MLQHFKYLCDENIPTPLIDHLKSKGVEVLSTASANLNSCPDIEIINFAYKNNFVIVTFDADFGKYIYTQQINFIGLIYLRPGHLNPSIHQQTINALFTETLSLTQPFVIIAEHLIKSIKIRVRCFTP